MYFFLPHLSSSSSSRFWWAGITFDFACPIFLCLSSVRISDRYLRKSSTPSSSLSLENWIESLVENLLQIRKYVNVSTNLKSVFSLWNESESWARNLSLSLKNFETQKIQRISLRIVYYSQSRNRINFLQHRVWSRWGEYLENILFLIIILMGL